VNALQTSDKL
jgi:hypothetical protein